MNEFYIPEKVSQLPSPRKPETSKSDQGKAVTPSKANSKDHHILPLNSVL